MSEEYIIAYVIERMGEGSETYLYERGEVTGDPILRQQLDPGQIILFKDEQFKDGATPLAPPPGEKAVRDVLVCTVDYCSTYLATDRVS
jgi:hypothetical protein